jgi:hypothetical protein
MATAKLDKWSRELKQTFSRGHLVEIERGTDDEMFVGFVVDVSPELLMLHSLTEFHLDGYTVLRNKDIKSFRLRRDNDQITKRVLKARNILPLKLPEVSLESLSELLLTADAQFPLLAVYREARKGKHDTFVLGRVIKLTAKTVTLKLLEPDATWGETARLNLSSITRIEFGREYDDGLWMINQQKSKLRRKKP